MNPRLKTSKNWLEFPKEQISQIKNVFEKKFNFKDYHVLVDGKIYKEEMILQVGLRDKKQEFLQYNFEVSMNHKKTKISECIFASVDMIDLLVKDFLKNGFSQFPNHWYPYQTNLYIQCRRSNSDLEKKAEALLNEKSPDSLIKGNDTKEFELDQIKNLFNLDN